MPLGIPLPTVLDGNLFVFKYSSFIRGYHVYKDRWQSTVGDDPLRCKEKKNNEYNKHAVAIIYDSYHSNKVVGHVPLYWSELANKVLKLQNHYSCVFVTGKRVNRGLVLGLEIPVDYFFHGASRVTEWFKKSMKLLDKCTNVKVEICMK